MILTLGHLYVKSDVYGFGVVMLELLTGQRALDTRRASGQQNLVDWVKPLLSHKRKLKTVMDLRIEGQYSPKAALQTAQLALRCLEQEPRKRPPMKEVAEVLEQIAALEKPKESSSSRSTRSAASTTTSSNRHHRSSHSPRQPTKQRWLTLVLLSLKWNTTLTDAPFFFQEIYLSSCHCPSISLSWLMHVLYYIYSLFVSNAPKSWVFNPPLYALSYVYFCLLPPSIL